MTSIEDLEEMASAKLPSWMSAYYKTGTGDEQTMTDNTAAYKRFRFKPRILCADRNQDISVKVLGHEISIPIGIAPTAMHCGANPKGELASAAGAEKCGTVMIISSFAQYCIEDIVKAAPNTHFWMQTYLNEDRMNTLNITRRAEKLGFKAIVVTIDTPCLGIRKRKGFEDGDAFAKTMKGEANRRLINYQGATDGIERAKASGDVNLLTYVWRQIGCFAKWEDLTWLMGQTNLPIILKGIMTAESAKEAVVAGASGIIVSNHGGRQLDGVQATIEALPEIVDALRGTGVEVYVDGGIRNGSDVMKALAIGAKMVFVGRPIIWGLATNGSEGVVDVINTLRHELSVTMTLCGCSRLSDIDRSLIIHESQFNCKL